MKFTKVIYANCTDADKDLVQKRIKEEGFDSEAALVRALIRKGKLKK